MNQSKKTTVKADRKSIAAGESCAELTEMLSKVQIQQEAIAEHLQKIASSAIVQNSYEYQQLKSLAACLPLFEYPSETFDEWYFKYGAIFREETTPLSDRAKVQLLLSRLGRSELKRCLRYESAENLSFRETISILMSSFAKPKSLTTRRLQYLQLEKEKNEDMSSYSLRVEKAFCAAEMEDIRPNELKCLMFVAGLQSPKEAILQRWLIHLIDETVPELPWSRLQDYYYEGSKKQNPPKLQSEA
uniref:DUF7083 domain-containing protein n=2 Tax=Anopheles albimanus TaxID=7167 RepID=A0A182FVU9_ANOAL